MCDTNRNDELNFDRGSKSEVCDEWYLLYRNPVRIISAQDNNKVCYETCNNYCVNSL